MDARVNRDPALWVSLGSTSVKLVAAFIIDLSPDAQSLLNAALAAGAGAFIAVTVKDGQVGAILGFVQALIALAIGMGLGITAEGQALIMSFIGTAVAAFTRTQVTAPLPPKP